MTINYLVGGTFLNLDNFLNLVKRIIRQLKIYDKIYCNIVFNIYHRDKILINLYINKYTSKTKATRNIYIFTYDEKNEWLLYLNPRKRNKCSVYPTFYTKPLKRIASQLISSSTVLIREYLQKVKT